MIMEVSKLRMNNARHTAKRLMFQRKTYKSYYDEWTLAYLRSKIGSRYINV